MKLKCGVLCSSEARQLAVLIEAVEAGRLPIDIKIVVTDRDSPALNLARSAGLYGVFLPRSAFHANRDGYERRLLQLLTEVEAEAAILTGFDRELGPVFEAGFAGPILGRGLGPQELEKVLEKQIRHLNIRLVPSPAAVEE